MSATVLSDSEREHLHNSIDRMISLAELGEPRAIEFIAAIRFLFVGCVAALEREQQQQSDQRAEAH